MAHKLGKSDLQMWPFDATSDEILAHFYFRASRHPYFLFEGKKVQDLIEANIEIDHGKKVNQRQVAKLNFSSLVIIVLNKITG